MHNNKILAEREARRQDFKKGRSFDHPENFRAAFRYGNELSRNNDLRDFGERIENYRENYGAYPKYIFGTLDYMFHYVHSINFKVQISVEPFMDDEEYATFIPRWRVVLTKEEQYRETETLRNEILNVETGHQLQASMKTLGEIFLWVLQMTEPVRRDFDNGVIIDHTENVNSLLWKFNDVFNAVQGIYKTNFELWHETLAGGYFGGTFDDTVMINIDYNTAFVPRFVKEFIEKNTYLNRSELNFDVRLSDGKRGMYAWWVLTRQDGVWVMTTAADGRETDFVVTNSEEVRGHVYWHVMNEVKVGDQQVAFAKSQYAADIFDAVEREIPTSF